VKFNILAFITIYVCLSIEKNKFKNKSLVELTWNDPLIFLAEGTTKCKILIQHNKHEQAKLH